MGKVFMENCLPLCYNFFIIDKNFLEKGIKLIFAYFNEKGENDRVKFSDEFRRMLKVSKTEMPDESEAFQKIVHPDDVNAASELIGKQLADPSGSIPFDMEYRMLHKDGKYRWFRASSYIVWEDGQAVMAAGTILDITEQKDNKIKFASDLKPAIDYIRAPQGLF